MSLRGTSPGLPSWCRDGASALCTKLRVRSSPMSENNESASNLIRTSFSKKLLKWWDMQRNPGAGYPATRRGLRHIPRLPDRRFAGSTETDAEAFAHTVKNLAGVAVVASRKTDDVDDETRWSCPAQSPKIRLAVEHDEQAVQQVTARCDWTSCSLLSPTGVLKWRSTTPEIRPDLIVSVVCMPVKDGTIWRSGARTHVHGSIRGKSGTRRSAGAAAECARQRAGMDKATESIAKRRTHFLRTIAYERCAGIRAECSGGRLRLRTGRSCRYVRDRSG